MSSPASKEMHWFEVHWPRPLDADRALSLLRSWATEGRTPQLVLEVRGTKAGVVYLLGVPAAAVGSTRSSLQAHLPAMTLVETVRRSHPFDRTVSLRATSRHRPLRTELTQSVVRSTLAALTRVQGTELLVLQIVLGPRRVPMAVPTRSPSSTTGSIWQVVWYGKGQQLDGEKRQALRAKVSDHGFACTIRLGVCASPDRRRGLIANLFSGLRTSEAAGLKLQLRRDSSRRAGLASRPALVWPLRLNCSELLALSAWPLGDEVLPGQAPLHPKRLLPIAGTDGNGRSFAVSAAPGVDAPLGISAANALHHSWVLGPTGSGKSTLLGRLIEADIRDGRSVVVVEPKGDLVDDVLRHIPRERWDDVVVLDPTDSAPVGLNPLSGQGRRPEIVADSMLAVFRQIYGEAIGPRSADILYASLLTLARKPGASLVMLPLLLTNDGFRRSMTANLADPIGLEPFWAQYNAWSPGERAAAIAPVMNKLRPLLRPTLRAVLGQQDPRISIRQVFTERKIFLLPLRRGLIGPEAATLLGSLAVAELWQAIQERSAVPASRRHPVMVYIDEVQDYLHLGTDLGDALAQARGYGVGFHLAHQFVGQLSPGMKGAIASNARSRIGFQLGHADAVELAKGHGELSAEDFMALGQYEIYASVFAAGRVTPYAIGRTVPPSKAISSAQELRGLSRARFGRPVDEIEASFAALIKVEDATLGSPGRRRRQP
jgi:hypothetical protein